MNSPPNIIRNLKSRRLSWAKYVVHVEESRNKYRVLEGRPEGKGPLGKPKRRCQDNITIYLKEAVSDVVYRCGAGGSMRACHAVGLGSFSGFFSPVRQISGSFRPTRSPNIVTPVLISMVWRVSNSSIQGVKKCRIFLEVRVPTKTRKNLIHMDPEMHTF